MVPVPLHPSVLAPRNRGAAFMPGGRHRECRQWQLGSHGLEDLVPRPGVSSRGCWWELCGFSNPRDIDILRLFFWFKMDMYWINIELCYVVFFNVFQRWCLFEERKMRVELGVCWTSWFQHMCFFCNQERMASPLLITFHKILRSVDSENTPKNGQARCPLMIHSCKLKWIAAQLNIIIESYPWLSPHLSFQPRLSIAVFVLVSGRRPSNLAIKPWRIQRSLRWDPWWWRWWVWKVKRSHCRCCVSDGKWEDAENWVEICWVQHLDLMI